ncbi:PD40 domain-containing protein [Burkholderia pseudomallei]|uniref:LVIVD repeat-containing protein n=1 Tax=Burkholderia pseudomallei TaxID=28450 RepID=UPI001AD642E5|nr:PD40 domain-containing protein [Burkholderia pseudomallei]MBO7932030.1 PD40 domain-containing protein [Burkholderia pseudomallei]
MRSLAMLLAIGSSVIGALAWADTSNDISTNGATAVPAARCGPGSTPETALQGQVPLADRQSGRNQQGYTCNMTLVGQYRGEGASWVNASTGTCAYMATSWYGIAQKTRQGVQVVNASDPAHPAFATNLTTNAMFTGTWESLKVNDQGTMLAGAGVGPVVGIGMFDLYDVRDCAHPMLLNRMLLGGNTPPLANAAHEGGWSPDGRTYWTTGFTPGSMTAIDVSNPTAPKTIYLNGSTLVTNHGFSFSPDGNRMYLTSSLPSGIAIVDVSDIQNRLPLPVVRQVSALYWTDGSVTQKTIPVTYGGRSYLIVTDELANGGVRFIDITNEQQPQIVSHLRLAIQLPQNRSAAVADSAGNGAFQYDVHYCNVDRAANPTALACGYFQSGIRVFNIVDPLNPKEIAYYNPPARPSDRDSLPGSEHAMLPVRDPLYDGSVVDPVKLMAGTLAGGRANLSTDWCSSPPRFVNGQLWVTCQDNGFMVLKFDNGVYPIGVTSSGAAALPASEQDSMASNTGTGPTDWLLSVAATVRTAILG